MSKRSAMDIDAVSDEIGIGVLSQDLLSSKSSPKHGTQNETLEDGNDQPSAERIEASDSKVSLFFFFFSLYSYIGLSFFCSLLVLSVEENLSRSSQFRLQCLPSVANVVMTQIFLKIPRFRHQSLKKNRSIRFPKYRLSAFILQKSQTVVSYGTVLVVITTLIF